MSILKGKDGSRQKLTIFPITGPLGERVEGMGEGKKREKLEIEFYECQKFLIFFYCSKMYHFNYS